MQQLLEQIDLAFLLIQDVCGFREAWKYTVQVVDSIYQITARSSNENLYFRTAKRQQISHYYYNNIST
jgi:hypothetical protein